MKIYGAGDVAIAKRMVSGLVPSGVSVAVSILNSGMTLRVMVQGGPDFHAYDFGLTERTATSPGRFVPHFSRPAVLEIADEWETGRRLPKAKGPDNSAPAPVYVRSRQDLALWLSSQTKANAVYFVGDLATFRKEGAKRVVEINRIEDRRSGRMPLKAPLRRERAGLQATIELIEAVKKYYQKGVITLSQRRVGTEINYLAMKAANMAVNPAEQMRLQKQVRNAIRTHWDKNVRRGDFTIIAIEFEGGHDEIHNTTARVEVYRSNPQQPVHFRIPVTDLGDEQEAWGAILDNKAKAVMKMIRSREGREPTNAKTKQLMGD